VTRLTPVGVAGALAAVALLGAGFGPEGVAGGVGLLAVWYLLPAPVAIAAGQGVAATLVVPLGDPLLLWGFEGSLAAMLFGDLVADYGPGRGTTATVVALAIPGGVAYGLATGALPVRGVLAVLAGLGLVGTGWLALYADRTAIPAVDADRASGATGPARNRTAGGRAARGPRREAGDPREVAP
jgi:hypothetical protein